TESLIFFFRAEDGIRDGHVTGVQTCALPISSLLLASYAAAQTEKKPEGAAKTAQPAFDFKAHMQKIMDAWSTLDPSKAAPFYSRSEERRVGKECRSRCSPYH